MDNNSVKNNISKRRKAFGISQIEMAEKLGMSRTAYRNIEKGCTKLINSNVCKIASLLDTTTEEIVLGYKPSEQDSNRLKDIQSEFDTQKAAIESEYKKEIIGLKAQIEALTDYVDTMKDVLKTKDEIIAMLKKNLAGKDVIE